MAHKKPEFDFTKRDVLQWLAGQAEEDIRTVLMVIGRDPDVEVLELHGESEDLVEQLAGTTPRLDNIVAAIDEALGIDAEMLALRVHGDFTPVVEPEEIEVELDDEEELDLGPDDTDVEF
jgi:hypothetical protein